MIANLFTLIFFLKANKKYYGDKNTNFHDKKVPKIVHNHNCLAVISLGSILKKDENYYQQVFLK